MTGRATPSSAGTDARRRASGPAGVVALLAALVVSTLAGPGAAAANDEATRPDPSTHIAKAVDAYSRAMESDSPDERLALFAESERRFAAAIAAGVENADLETNRGNAALQAERTGPAVLAYRRALRLEPGHQRARQNLAHARGLLPGWVPTPADGGLASTFFFWRDQLSSARLLGLAAGCFALGAAALSLAIVRRGPGWRLAGGLAMLVWLALLASAVLDPRRAEENAGVVIAPEATARAADSLNAPRRFAEPLPGGTELRILEDRGGWLHVELHNGRQAWLLASAVGRVGGDPASR